MFNSPPPLAIMWPYIIIVMNYCTWLIFIQYIQLYSSSLEKRLGRSWMDPCLLGRSSPFHNFLPPFRLNEHWITAITVGNYETVCIILQDYSFRSFVMSLFYSFLPICLLCLTLCGLGKIYHFRNWRKKHWVMETSSGIDKRKNWPTQKKLRIFPHFSIDMIP